MSPLDRLSTGRSKRSLSSSEDNSNSSDDDIHNDQKVNKAKSDKNKKDTLRNVFQKYKWGAKGKGQGQVLIVDHSEEAQTQQAKENQMPSDKLLSPIAYKPTNAEPIQHHHQQQQTQHQQTISKTPTSIPKTTELTSNINSNNNKYKSIETTSIMCSIDLRRLKRMPPDRNTIVSRQANRRNSKRGGSNVGDDDRLSMASPNDIRVRRFIGPNEDDPSNRISNSRDSSSSMEGKSSNQKSSIVDIAIAPTSNTKIGSSSSSSSSSSSIQARSDYEMSNVNERLSSKYNTVIHNSIESRLGNVDQHTIRNTYSTTHSPKLDEKPIGKAIKHEGLKSEFSNNEYNNYASPKSLTGDVVNSKLTNNYGSTIKRENIKTEFNADPDESQSSHKACTNDFAPHSRNKRSSSGSSSPYKDKRKKKVVVVLSPF